MSDERGLTQIAIGNNIAQAAAGGTAIVNVYERVAPRALDPAELTAATALLSTLPDDRVPEPAAVPPTSRLTLRRNPLFVGRERELGVLAAGLKSGRTTAVTGLGGNGKTQLASEFVQRYGQYFAGGVFWMAFADSRTVPREVAACGGVGHLDLRPDFATLPLDDQVKAVLAAWASPLPRLLIFDNCEDPQLLERWAPLTGGCRLLLTSRRAKWPRSYEMQFVPLDVLSREESVSLLALHLRSSDGDRSVLSAIADVLGDLPLALHLAGSVLAQYGSLLSPAQYLERIRQPGVLNGRWLSSAELSPTRHVQEIAATFAMSYERLDASDQTDALALDLWARAAHLAVGEPITRGLLLSTVSLSEDSLDDVLRAEDALARLVALGLIDRGDTGALRLHRLLVLFAQSQPGDAVARDAVERAMLAIAIDCIEQQTFTQMLALQPHLRAVADVALQRGDEISAQLTTILGDHLMRLGDFRGARDSYERALAVWKEREGGNDLESVLAMQKVALAYKEQGDYEAAERLFRTALQISDPWEGERRTTTIEILTNLGFVRKDRGGLAEAQRLFERALDMTKALHGGEALETAAALNNLGLAYKDRGELVQAQQCFERALAISRALKDKNKGPLSTVVSLNNLAFVRKDRGDTVAARAYFEEALSINKKVHGKEHAETVASLNNLAFLLVDRPRPPKVRPRGRFTGGMLSNDPEQYLLRALAIVRRMFPERHPRVAEALDSLGEFAIRKANYPAALKYFKRALAIRQELLGESHPETARNLHNLGRVLAAQNGGDMLDPRGLEEAKAYLERAVAAFARGPDPAGALSAAAHEALAQVRERERSISDYWSESYRSNSG